MDELQPDDIEFDEEDVIIFDEEDTSIIELDDATDCEDNIAEELEDVELSDAEPKDAQNEVVFEDVSKFTFQGHKDSIFCIRLDPITNQLVFTGGQDDQALLWRANSGDILLQCTGHQDSVISLGFSYNGVYAAECDMSGIIKVWKVDSLEEVLSFECKETRWIEWHPEAYILLAGTTGGEIWMWKVPGGECKIFQGHGQSSFCGRILPDGKRACIGYEDGCVKVLDLKAGNFLRTYADHKSSVTCIDCYHDNTVAITGSTDVTSRLINTHSGKTVGVLQCADDGSDADENNSVESVEFSKVDTLAAVGTLSSCVYIWDLPTGRTRDRWHFEGNLVKLKWMDSSPLIYTAGLDGVLRLWDVRNTQKVSEFKGHSDAILDFDVSKDGKTVVTASDDHSSKIFSLPAPN